VAAPVNAFAARVGSSPAQRINHVKLPVCAAAVSGQKLNQKLGWHTLLGHAGKRGRGQQGVDKRLGCQGTDTALGMRTQGTDCKKFAGNGDAKVAVGITRNDRPCHKFFSINKTRILQKEVFNKAAASRHLGHHYRVLEEAFLIRFWMVISHARNRPPCVIWVRFGHLDFTTRTFQPSNQPPSQSI
jgi:hypothetical protein